MPPLMSHLSPHNLGLLNSLQMMHHASPLEMMAAAHYHVPPRSYHSPPPISTSDPRANECKLIDYRGQKVAAFTISNETMLCLSQAFELFLKHLVGGVHTVYSKLKRLDIVPLVCNVEQVRVLRGLGAILPGVNRCKLLSVKDFDILFKDCTTARCLTMKSPESARPGRPPKRASAGLSMLPSHLPQLKKHRLENGDYAYEINHVNDISRIDKSGLPAGYNPALMPFMHHHPNAGLLNPNMPPHALSGGMDNAMIKAVAQSGLSAAGMDAILRSGIWKNCGIPYEDIVKHLERLRKEEINAERQASMEPKPLNDSSNHHSPVLNLSRSVNGYDRRDKDRSLTNTPASSALGDDEYYSEADVETQSKGYDLSDNEPKQTSPEYLPQRPLSYSTSDHMTQHTNVPENKSNCDVDSQHEPPVVGHHETSLGPSIETLLRNIEVLLTVAADNARQEEKQTNFEKAELRLDVIRERGMKDTLEKRIIDERKLRVLYQKRYRRQRKMRLRLQQEVDTKRKLTSCSNNKNVVDLSFDITKESQPKDIQIRSDVQSTTNNISDSDDREVDIHQSNRLSPPIVSNNTDRVGGEVPKSDKPPTWSNYPGVELASGNPLWQNNFSDRD